MSRALLAAQSSPEPACYLVRVSAGVLPRGREMEGRPLGGTQWLARGVASLQAPRFVDGRPFAQAVRVQTWQMYPGGLDGAGGRLLSRREHVRCGLCGLPPEAGLRLDGWCAMHLLAPPWTVRP